MGTFTMIIIGFVFGLSLVTFALSYYQFNEKGPLLNNAYVYASKTERETMDMTPYYRQSAVSFFLLGLMFLSMAVGIVMKSSIPFYLTIIITIILIAYALFSTFTIEKRRSR